MDEVEVNVVEAQLLEALAQGALRFLGTVTIVPQLGGHEEFVAGDAGVRDGAAHALFRCRRRQLCRCGGSRPRVRR